MSWTLKDLQKLMRPQTHGGKLGEALNNLRKENQLCDTTITVGSRTFDAHKSVLSANSKFFFDKFTCDENSNSDVSIAGKPEIFELLLEFAYTGNLEITDDTKKDIKRMARNMKFKNDICAKCIKTKSCPNYYTKNLVENLSNFREQNQLCDVVVNISGGLFRAHKAVLAANSKYFTAMFTSGFKEKNESEVKIEGDPDIFGVLLHFLYTGKLKVTVPTACDILEMACYMQFEGVRKACKKFIKSKYKKPDDSSEPKKGKARFARVNRAKPRIQITTEEVCKIWEVANGNGMKKLADVTEKYLCKHWKELKTLDVFLEVASVDFFKHFLKQYDLASEEEEREVLEMVVKWLKSDWENRRSHAHTVLMLVKLGLIPAEILTKFLDAEILEIPECKQLCDEALSAQGSDRPKAELIYKMPGLFATRSTITAPITLYTGEKKDTDQSEFWHYKVQEHTWESLPRFHNLDYLASLITVDGSLYAAGGKQKTIRYFQNFDWDEESDEDEELQVKRIDKECTDEFQVFDVAQSSWDYLPSMITARHQFPLLHLDGFIYAIGGEDEYEKSIMLVERYDMAKKEWKAVAPLPKGFHLASAVVYQDKILVYGELPNPDEEYSVFQQIIVYDPSKNEWKVGWSHCYGAYDGGIWFGSEDIAATPLLFVYKDTCYYVSYYPEFSRRDLYIDTPTPYVTPLSIGEGATTIELCKGVDEDSLSLTKVGAFQIKDEIFLNMRGFVYKTEIKVTPEMIEDYEEVYLDNTWDNMAAILDHDSSNIVNFTFDMKKLSVYPH